MDDNKALDILRESFRAELLHRDEEINKGFVAIRADINQYFLRKETFEAVFSPVRSLVYGLTAMILVAVVGALLALVVRGK